MAESRTTVHVAQAIHTMDDEYPVATAVAVRAGRIVAVGSLDEVTAELGSELVDIDTTHRDHVLLPGLIDQHLHPLLAATTLATEVIATEDWVLPERTFEAANSHDEYIGRLAEAETGLDDPDEWLISWGYHELWHGVVNREILDTVSSTRPIGIWQRSCHEWFMNTAAIERLELTPDSVAGRGAVSDMVDLDTGHAWEVGFFNLVLPKVSGVLLDPDRMTFGLRQMAAYLHQHGVTAFNEPGIVWRSEPVELYQQILGADDVPLLSTFMVDGRTQAALGIDPADVVADAERQMDKLPAEGKVSLFRNQVKLFADGAIISQLMVMTDPYLDRNGDPDPSHRGEWIIEPGQLAAYFRAYWDAGWQIHTHVNGDEALEVLLDIMEDCQRTTPRRDHRCVIVHFANSTEAQVERIGRLGAIVSANPYYPVGFADKYGEYGLGPERADAMVRSASVLRNRIPLSFHSDLPMAPAQPLFLASCAVNRITPSGRVAGPEQRINVTEALAAVTIGAAYSWRMDHELGSVTPGKRATFTVLAEDPHEVDPADLHLIPVVGTVYQGRWFPVPDRRRAPTMGDAAATLLSSPKVPGGGCGSDDQPSLGCSCEVARRLAAAYRDLNAAA
jgi:predicted amidohydrolase YtcJ